MAATDLCALADVRTLMQKATSDTGQDALISALIGPASKVLMDEYEQEWAPVTASATRTFEIPRDQTIVSLAPYAARAITAVVMDADQDGAGVTLSADEWRPWPKPSKDGVILSLKVQPFSGVVGRQAWRNREVKVSGSWGYAAVPDDVKQAAAFTVRHWVVSNAATHMVPDDSAEGQAPVKRGIPGEARELLKRYRRYVV